MGERGSRGTIARTTRPRDRKAQIISAASDLFYRFGYHNVGTEDIAEAVGITAGALYRHFRSKQDLLASALIDSFDRAQVVIERHRPGRIEDMVQGIAETAGARRDLGVLWNREIRHLDDERRQRVRARFFGFLAGFTEALREARPELSADQVDLLAWCSLAVLTSPSYHRTAVPAEGLAGLLREMTLGVCTADLSRVSPGTRPGKEVVADSNGPGHTDDTGAVAAIGAADGPAKRGVPLHSRREALLAAASRLFNRRGYQTVTMEEIGAEVGVTSTSIYRYFTTKVDLLTAIIARGTEPLQLGLSQALSRASTPLEGLSNAVTAYIEFAMSHHDLVGVLVAEVMNLPEPHRSRIRRAQHDYVVEWIRLMEAIHPELGRGEAAFRVHAALTVVNDVARTTHLRSRPRITDELMLITGRVLHGA